MNSNVKCIIGFVAGATVGAVASWYVLREKYKNLAQEEIDSVKEVFGRKFSDDIPEEDEEPEPEEGVIEDKPASKMSIVEYASRIVEEDYAEHESVDLHNVFDKKGMKQVMEKPYVISPDEFGELFDYETVSLTYYADSVLADELDELVDDVEGTVGFDSLTHFGEYEDDSVFVRNDKRKCDYEILADSRKYTDVLKTKPYVGGYYDEERE